AIADASSHTIKLHPAHVRLIDSALEDQILHQAAHSVVGERGDNRRVQSEAALQPTSNVVLTATFGDAKAAAGGDAVVPGIERQHDLTQSHAVPAAITRGLDFESAHACPSVKIFLRKYRYSGNPKPIKNSPTADSTGRVNSVLSTSHAASNR